jgi:hypothetical protein
VRARNGAGAGDWSEVVTVKVAVPPPAPTGVYADDRIINPKMETLTVVWNASAGADSYKVKDTTSGFVQTTTGTSLRVASGMPILIDSYAVAACNVFACSAYVDATYRDLIDAPTIPPTLSVPSGSTGSYTVSWNDVSQATSYVLQESANGGAWATLQNSSATSRAISHGNGTYGYRVEACNSHGCSVWSTTRSVTVAKPPAVPTGAYVENYFTAKLEGYKAHWNAVSGATRYEAKRNDTGASVYSGTGTSFIMGTAVIPNAPTYYQFSVRACNAAACSGWAVGH